MSVWDTFSASFHLVQEKLLEQVLEDTPTTTNTMEEEEPKESVDGEESEMVTSEQPRSPIKPGEPGVIEKTRGEKVPEGAGLKGSGEHGRKVGGEMVDTTALEAAEQQMLLIHEEYKKLLREKEAEISQLKSVGKQGTTDQSDVDLDVVSKELAAHKEMVSVLRGQLAEKENELQELNSKAEGKFNRLKTQAKAKITSLNQELEKFREEQGKPQLDLSAQLLDNSVLSVGGEGERQDNGLSRQLLTVQNELTECERELKTVQEERDAVKQQLDSLTDKLNVSEVCLDKERGERVRLELRITELEEEMETQTTSTKLVAEQLQQSLAEEHAHNQNLLVKIQQMEQTRPLSGRHKSSTSSTYQDVSVGILSPTSNSPLPTSDDQPSSPHITTRPAVMAAGDRGSLIDMEQEISQLESSLKEKDSQLSSFKIILEQTQSELAESKQESRDLTAQFKQLTEEHTTLKEQMEHLNSQISESVTALEASSDTVHKLEEDVQRLRKEGEEGVSMREKLEQGIGTKEDELRAVMESLELQKKVLHDTNGKLLVSESELERVKSELQEMVSTNAALRGSVDGDRQSSADKLAQSLEQIQQLQLCVQEMQTTLEEKESVINELNTSRQTLELSLDQVNETLQHTENASHSESQRLASEFELAKQETQQKIASLEKGLELSTLERNSEKLQLKEAREQNDVINKKLKEVENERASLVGQLEHTQSQLNKTTGAFEFAESEMHSKSNVIQNLSQLLEEKKTVIAELTAEVSSVKSNGAVKLSEVLLQNEQFMSRNSAFEKTLSERESALKKQEIEIEKSKRCLEEMRESLALAEERLQIVQSQFESIEKEKQNSFVEKEELCGQVDTLSQSRTELEEKCRDSDERVEKLEAKVSQLSSQLADSQKTVQTTIQKLNKTMKELQETEAREKSVCGDLERSNKENRQMKQQFDSAVSLMESKVADLTQKLNRSTENIQLKDTEIVQLKEQTTSDRRKIGGLRERVTKSTADYKISSERCKLLEQECQQLRGRIGELMLQLNQMQAVCGDVTAERDSLRCEHQTLLSGIQEHETRTLQMTTQVAELAREKEGVESKLREMSRQLSLSELNIEQLNSELETMKLQLQDGQLWLTEKQILLEGQSRMEQEKAVVEASYSASLSQVKDLQTMNNELKQLLQNTQLELQHNRNVDSTKSEDVERRLVEAEMMHSSQITVLQQKLQEETEKREIAERSVEELRSSEIAIGMDDMQPTLSPVPQQQSGGHDTFVDYVNTAVTWGQRFVKNPNIVLTRLLRATPQTRLFFLAYFVILHFVILLMLIV